MIPAPSRILIVRLGAMGDIVHALPVLASLRTRWPQAAIDWLVEPRHTSLLDLVGGLTSAVVVDTRRVFGRGGWLDTVGRLRRKRYDLVLDVQGLIKSAVLARGAGAPRVVGFSRRAARERPAALFDTTRVEPGPARHVVDRNLAIAAAAGADGEGVRRRFDLRIPTAGRDVDAALARMGTRFAVLNPGGGWPNKRWPADRFGALAARLKADHDLPVAVIWGAGEQHLADTIAASSPGSVTVLPPTTVPDLLAVLARAAVVVSGDTGPLHLAAAAGTPVVGIYGPTDPARNGPWAAADITVSRRAQCPCFHQRRCHAPRWCLDDVLVDEVAQAVARRLETVVLAEADA